MTDEYIDTKGFSKSGFGQTQYRRPEIVQFAITEIYI